MQRAVVLFAVAAGCAGAIPSDRRGPGPTAGPTAGPTPGPTTGPPTGGSAGSTPGSSSFSGGQTGQSGTTPECAELDPVVDVLAFDATSSLGFSGAEAVASVAAFGSTARWADGAEAGLSGSLGADPDDPAPTVVERAVAWDDGCARVLELAARLALTTDDGRLGLDQPVDLVQVAALGVARVAGEGSTDDGWVDVGFVTDAPDPGQNLKWSVEVEGDQAAGFVRVEVDGRWTDVGAW